MKSACCVLAIKGPKSPKLEHLNEPCTICSPSEFLWEETEFDP